MINKKFKYNSMNVIIICVILSFLSLSQAEITLTIGNGAGYPGSEGNQVDISLDNQDDEVGGVQIDICDVDDYLSCTECNLTERTVDFTCLCYEQKNGCAGVVLYSPTCNFIDKDTGPIFSISYNVSEEAPPQENVEISIRKTLSFRICLGTHCLQMQIQVNSVSWAVETYALLMIL